MLSMVNVNRLILRIVMPAVLFIYPLFVAFDYLIEKESNAALVPPIPSVLIPRVEGLILGGSNAKMGLSAKEMSSITGIRWFNASIGGEAGSEQNYQEKLNTLANYIDPRTITHLVYSSINPMLQRGIDKHKRHMTIKPTKSGLSYIKNLFVDPIPDPDTDPYFNEYIFKEKECTFCRAEFRPESSEKAAEFLLFKIKYFSDLFINAKIVVTIPSQLYLNLSSNRKLYSWQKSVFRQLRILIENDENLRQKRIVLIGQPPFPDTSFVLDSNHANSLGRHWRTCHLISKAFSIEHADCTFSYLEAND